MASSGSFSGSIYNGHYKLQVDWTQSKDITNNQSTVTCKMYLVNDYSLSIKSRSNTCTIDGTAYTYNSSAISTKGTHALGTASKTIAHNSDGTKSITISVVFNIQATLTGTYYSKITASATITLDSIARASSVSATSVDMGTSSTIAISRASDAFTHTLTYAFGSTSGTIVTNTTSTSVSWTPPLTLANQIPNATSGVCTITCTTYNGSTSIGSKTCSITLSVPASVKPTIGSLSVSRVDGTVPSSWGIYVKSKSKATVTINNAAGSYGSTIKSYWISGGGYSGSAATLATGYLNTSGTITFAARVTDSRGRSSSSTTVSISVTDYSPPSFSSILSQRCLSTGVVNNDGTYVRAQLYYSYSTCSSKNTLTTAVYYKKASTTIWTNAGVTFSSGKAFTFGGGKISTDTSYDLRYVLTDTFGSTAVLDVVSTAAVVMDFKSGGKGVAIGKVSETNNCFEVASGWTTKLNGPVYLGTSTLGGVAQPIYLNAGKPTACTPASIVGGVCADYVVEQGTSGIWTYRKWNSGIAECWGLYSATGVNLTASHYSGFYYSYGITVYLPFTFASTPIGVYSGGCASYITFVTPNGPPTKSYATFWVACLDAGATSCKVNVSMIIRGRWK